MSTRYIGGSRMVDRHARRLMARGWSNARSPSHRSYIRHVQAGRRREAQSRFQRQGAIHLALSRPVASAAGALVLTRGHAIAGLSRGVVRTARQIQAARRNLEKARRARAARRSSGGR